MQRVKKRDIFLLTIFLAFSPLLQVGISYYLTIALPLFVLGVYLSTTYSNGRLFSRNTIILFASLLFVFSISYLTFGISEITDFLRLFKDVTLLCILSFCFSQSELRTFNIDYAGLKRTKACIHILSILMFMVVVVQSFALARKIPFVINPNLLGRNYENVATSSNIELFDRLRPSGTFGEPSYFSWYLIFLLCVTLELRKTLKSRIDFLCIFLLVTSVLLSRSGLGLIFLLCVVIFIGTQSTVDLLRRSMLIFFSIIAAYLFDSSLLSNQITQSLDSRSWLTRIKQPFDLYLPFLAEHPFGVPLRRIFSQESPFLFNDIQLSKIIGHGFSYFIFGYGIVGLFAALAISISALKFNSVVFIFTAISFFQNGSFLDFDKLSLLMFIVLLSRINKSRLISHQIEVLK